MFTEQALAHKVAQLVTSVFFMLPVLNHALCSREGDWIQAGAIPKFVNDCSSVSYAL